MFDWTIYKLKRCLVYYNERIQARINGQLNEDYFNTIHPIQSYDRSSEDLSLPTSEADKKSFWPSFSI